MTSPRIRREIPQRYRLEANKCKNCGSVFFPHRLVCSKCGNKEFESVKLKDEGVLVTFTIIRVASERFALQTPYAVGIIELDDGVRLTAQITDANLNEIAIGKRVKLVLRLIQDDGKSGLHCYGYKAILV